MSKIQNVKNQHFILGEDIYGSAILVIIGPTKYARKVLDKYTIKGKRKRRVKKDIGGKKYNAVLITEGRFSLMHFPIYQPTTWYAGIVSHECLHYTLRVMEHVNIPLKKTHSEEAWAYFHTWIMREILNKIEL